MRGRAMPSTSSGRKAMPSLPQGRPLLAPYRWQLVVISVAVVVVAIFAAVVLLSSAPGAGGPCYCPEGNCSCPPSWTVTQGPHIAPGSYGCQNLPGESCYAGILSSSVTGMHLSTLRFELLGPPWNSTNLLNSTPVTLGASARVTALAPNQNAVGAWEWQQSDWSQGGNWVIPAEMNVTLVLDTGVQNTDFSGDLFCTFFSTPPTGSAGFSL